MNLYVLLFVIKVVYAKVKTLHASDMSSPLVIGQVWLVVFSATWCGPCQDLKPKFLAASEKVDIRFGRVDCDEEESLCAQYNVLGMPTVLALGGGIWAQRGDGSSILYSDAKEARELVAFARIIARNFPNTRESKKTKVMKSIELAKTTEQLAITNEAAKSVHTDAPPLVRVVSTSRPPTPAIATAAPFDLEALTKRIVEYKRDTRGMWLELGGAALVKKLEKEGFSEATWPLVTGALMLASTEVSRLRKSEISKFVKSTRLTFLLERHKSVLQEEIFKSFSSPIYTQTSNSLDPLLRAPFWKLDLFMKLDTRMKRMILTQKMVRKIAHLDHWNFDILNANIPMDAFIQAVLERGILMPDNGVYRLGKIGVEKERYFLLAAGRYIGLVFMTGKRVPIQLDLAIYMCLVSVETCTTAMKLIRTGFYDVVPLHLFGRVRSTEFSQMLAIPL